MRYLRVSKMGDRVLGSEEFRSPSLQIEAIDRELDRRFGPGGWRLPDLDGNYTGEKDEHIKGTWADVGVSGTSMRRQGLDAAIAAVGPTSATALAVLNLSRWARNVLGALRSVADLEAAGAWLISAQEEVNFLTPQGRFVTTMFLSMAEMFSGQKGEEWEAVIEQRSRAGLHHGVVPLGYAREADGLLVPDHRAHGVAVAFTMVAGGTSRTAAGTWLRDQGLVSRPNSAHSILTNRVYVRRHAASCWGTECAISEAHGPYGEVRSSMLEKAPDGAKRRVGSVWYPARHEGLVDAEVFARAQTRIAAARSTGNRQRPTAVHELAGVLRCSKCGYLLGGHVRKGSSRVVFQDSNGRMRGCDGVGMVTADRILDVVKAELEEVVRQTHAPTAIIAGHRRTARAGRRASDTAARTVEVRRRALERIGELRAGLDVGDFEGREEAVLAQVAALERRVADADSKLAQASTATSELAFDGLAMANDLTAHWDELDVGQRNTVLRQIVTVFVGPRRKDGPFRQPYAERLSARWVWERNSSTSTSTSAAR